MSVVVPEVVVVVVSTVFGITSVDVPEIVVVINVPYSVLVSVLLSDVIEIK